jgi:stress response protein YsnF
MSKDRVERSETSKNESLQVAETKVIPLVEEKLSVGKREVERGRVRVHVQVREREEVVRQELASDEVSIRRVPQNVRVAEIPQMRTEGSTTIIPVVEEVLVTEKVLMLVEEIHIDRGQATEVHELPVRLRSEHAEIEHDTDRGTHPSPGRS